MKRRTFETKVMAGEIKNNKRGGGGEITRPVQKKLGQMSGPPGGHQRNRGRTKNSATAAPGPCDLKMKVQEYQRKR